MPEAASPHPIPEILFSVALPRISVLIESARRRVAGTANWELVALYWNIGRIITQEGGRVGHGKQLIEKLAAHLTRQYGRGFSATNLWDMRRFYNGFQIPQTASGELALLLPHTPEPRVGRQRVPIDF